MVRFILFAVFALILAVSAYIFAQNPDWKASFELLGYKVSVHLGILVFAGLITLWLFG